MNISIEKQNKFFAMCAFIFITAPVVYTVVFFFFGGANLVSIGTFIPFVIVVAAISAGYGLQSAASAIMRIERVPAEEGYETGKKYYTPKKSLPSVAVAVIIAIVTNSVMHTYLQYRANIGLDPYYDKHSISPLLTGVAVFSLIYAGIVLWFYPYQRLVNLRSTLVTFAVFLMVFITVYITNNRSGMFFVLCLVGFSVSSFIVLNQDYLLKMVKLTEFSVLTRKMRRYNKNMVLGYLAAAAVVALVVLSFLVGAFALFRLVMATLFRAFTADEASAYRKPKENTEMILESAFGGMIGESQSTGSIMFFISVFLVVIAAAAIFFIIFRNKDYLRMLITYIEELLKGFFALFDRGHYSDDPAEQKEIISYRDEEIILRPDRPQDRHDYSRIRNYRDFTARLSRIDDLGDKISFAYVALLDKWRGAGIPIKPSDTPRRIKHTVESQTDVSSYQNPTDIIERLKYSGGTPAPELAAAALDELCALAEVYFG